MWPEYPPCQPGHHHHQQMLCDEYGPWGWPEEVQQERIAWRSLYVIADEVAREVCGEFEIEWRVAVLPYPVCQQIEKLPEEQQRVPGPNRLSCCSSSDD